MRISILFAICLFASEAFSQNYVALAKPAGSARWGYINLKGELIIKTRVQLCGPFSNEGFAPVYDKERNKYYFINLKGEQVHSQVYGFQLLNHFNVEIEGYNNGLAPVLIGSHWGYLATDGGLGITAKYDKAYQFSDGYAIAKKADQFLVLNTRGQEFPVSESGVRQVRQFSEGLAPYLATNNKFGFIGPDGKVVIPPQFESVGYFVGGLAWAKAKSEKVGYINQSGEWVIKPQFDTGMNFDIQSGLARVSVKDKWVYTNKTGDILNIADADSFESFSEGLALAKKNHRAGFLNNKGEWAILPQFEAARDFKNGYAAAKANGKWGVINRQGTWVIEPTFNGIKDMELVR